MSTASSKYIYTAVYGDTWDSIAYKMYQYEERMATTLIQANPYMSGVVMFEGGEQVTVPKVDKVITPESLPPWRR